MYGLMSGSNKCACCHRERCLSPVFFSSLAPMLWLQIELDIDCFLMPDDLMGTNYSLTWTQ